MIQRILLRLAFAGLVLAFSPLWAQSGSGLSLSVEPSVLVPFPGSPSVDRFGLGWGASVDADWIPPAAPFLCLGGSLDYSSVPSGLDEVLSAIGASAGAGLRWNPFGTLTLGLDGRGGLSYGMLGEAGALTPYASAEAAATLYLSSAFRVRLAAGYLHQFAASEPLYQGLSVTLSAGVNFNQLDSKARTEIRDIVIVPVFPVFYKYYDENSLGTLTLHNIEGGAIKNVRVTVFVPQYMDAPKECATIPVIQRGESVTVDLYALFTRQILTVLEPTKAQAQIGISYEYAGGEKSTSVSTVIEINHRNASLWDDDRKAASFVTMNDPAVMRLAKAAAGIARSSGYQTLDASLRQGVGILEQLRLYGVQYVPDPKVPYAASSKNEHAVDYLQFPAQTLDYRAGDCDDMSILYAALLEAAGVESAFITVPGHIFTAFALGLSPAQGRSFFTNYGDLIEYDGKLWMPVEVTLWNDGFMKAWLTGARQWREAKSKGQAVIYPVRDAWELYEPVAMIGSESSVELPKAEQLGARFKASMDALIAREMESFLRTASAGSSKDPAALNKQGLVYARFGMLAKAEEVFRSSLKVKETATAWINLGNVLFVQGDAKAALAAFQTGRRLNPTSLAALVGLVLTSSELGYTDDLSRFLGELDKASPDTAARYAFVAAPGAARASDASTPSVTWEE